MGVSIGIDLGTTNSAVATATTDPPKVIERATGERLLPSVIGLLEDGTRVVGEEARLLLETRPELVATATKRFIGQRWTAELAAKARQHYPYSLVAGPAEDVRIKLGHQTLPISQISAMLLSELRTDAEEYFNADVTDVVITVPATFTDAQRNATREAAEIAGLNVLRLLNEPTAAAMAFGLAHGFKGNALVFDLGGGTFDVSVLRAEEGVFEVLSTAGDAYFGGDDFDNVLVQWLLGHVQEPGTRERITKDRVAVQQLKLLAERAKREVSSAEVSRISTVLLPDSKHPIPIETMLTRNFFERLVRPKTEHALSIVEKALHEANLGASQVDTVLLVGGMTRVPLLRELVAKHFGREPDSRVDPDEAVALGVAIHAAELVEKRGNVLLLDVLGSSLGVEVAGGLVKPLLARNTMLPCHATEIFYPGKDGQTHVRVPVVQGESKRSEENVRVGQIELTEMLSTLRREHPLEVTFAMDAQGMLSVNVVDQLSGKTEVVKVDQRANLARSETTALAEKEDERRTAAQNSADADERRKNRHARRALHGVLVAVRRLQRELQHVAREADEADAKQMSETLAKEILAADLVERSGSRHEVEQMTDKLMKLLEQ